MSNPTSPVLDVDALAQEIRRVDGSHSLGAGALAEALMPFLVAHGLPAAEAPQRASDTLEANVRYLLDKCPYTIRDISGERTGMRGREDLVGSLSITFLGMQSDLTKLRAASPAAGNAEGATR